MPHSFSYAVSMNLEHSIKEGSHERYPDHLQCFRNMKKIKYPDFQAMTFTKYIRLYFIAQTPLWCTACKVHIDVYLYKIHVHEH